MAASIIEFVDVTINLAGALADRFGFGAVLGVFTHSVTANRIDGPYTSSAEAAAAGFSAPVTDWADAVFAQSNAVDRVYIGRRDPADATWTDTMNAIAAAGDDKWYITNIESRATADILEVAGWIEPRTDNPKIFIAQSSDPDILAGVAGNVADQLQAANYNRTALIYHDDDTEFLDGAWSGAGGGLNLDVPDGAGVWAYKQLSGVPYDDVTAAEAANIYSYDANLFGRLKGLNFTSKGTMASGRFIDVTTSLDWLKLRTEEKILETFVGQPTKVPYTNAGIGLIVAAIQDVLDRGVSFGHLAPDPAPEILAPDAATLSPAVKQSRELTVTVNATLAGAIQKATIVFNLSF